MNAIAIMIRDLWNLFARKLRSPAKHVSICRIGRENIVREEAYPEIIMTIITRPEHGM